MEDLTSKTIDWPLTCKRCGQRGVVTMEGRVAVATSAGFFIRMKHPEDKRHLIACAVCDAIHPYPP